MKKLVSKRGFTLAEMLIAVILLGIVSLMATVMTSAVLNTTVTMKEVAQAEILGGAALDNIQSELRFAQNVRLAKEDDNDIVTFNHDLANKDCQMKLKDGKIILQIKQPDGPDQEAELFVGVSYDNGNLKISGLKFKKVGESVEATVTVSFNDHKLWQGSVSVRPINGAVTIPEDNKPNSSTAP